MRKSGNDYIIDSEEIAQYIVNECIRIKHPISNLHLQRILYYLKEKISREDLSMYTLGYWEKWGFGPCVPNIYYHFCGWAGTPIRWGKDFEAENDIKYQFGILWLDSFIYNLATKDVCELVRADPEYCKAWIEVDKAEKAEFEPVNIWDTPARRTFKPEISSALIKKYAKEKLENEGFFENNFSLFEPMEFDKHIDLL